MAGYNVRPIDLSKLEIQLQLAIEEDKKYKRENAAKFRAIEQSKTYEEFRNIVKASHLKPLDKHESLCSKEMRTGSWKNCANKKLKTPGRVQITLGNTCALDRKLKLNEILESKLGYHNFHQFWLMLSKDLEGRMQLLEKATLVENIFEGHDMSVDLIVGIMEALNDSLGQNPNISDEAYDLAIRVMRSMCSTPRFSLHILFLSEKERNIIDELKEKVKVHLQMKETKEALRDGASMSLTFLDNL